ncbi:hypothetical protein A5643_09120 [Mycobacterium sp. 1274756.6]|nr:hypothetical protein A5643_09120 [Mycobacterium sp. 1274756.6]
MSLSGLRSPSPPEPSLTPIAVIGMGCRLPGGIDSPDQLWTALLRGADLVTAVPAARWDPEQWNEPATGRPMPDRGAFLDDIAGFDRDFFGISEQEAAATDPQHRLLLETCWEAIERAGIDPSTLAESRAGVFIGLAHSDYQLLGAAADPTAEPYGFTGSDMGLASGRIARALKLRGPALTVDTAGSAGLTAVHLACHSLYDDEAELALAGGAALLVNPRRWASGSAEETLSPSGRCRAFDAEADGTVPGEGCVVVLLKRLADAQRDGDRVLALIRGTAATRRDYPGGTAGYRKALVTAGIAADTVGMVETHGAGSAAADRLEYAGLAEVYGRGGTCALAAATTNFGHTQAASGVLGLMKAVLALQNGVIPQNLHFTRLPEALAAISTGLVVPQENMPWPATLSARRAAVSSFGASGSHVHVVLEQAAGDGVNAAPAVDGSDDLVPDRMLFPLSSGSTDALRRTARRIADWLQAHDEVALPDLAYTLAHRRAHRRVRAVAVARTRAQLVDALHDIAGDERPYPSTVDDAGRGSVWVFPGPGPEWAVLGAELLATEPAFNATVRQAEPLILRESGFSVTEALTNPQFVCGQGRIEPTLFALQVGLAATLNEYGVRPGAVIGCSLGETAAAVVAGALSFEDGVLLACRRSRLTSRLPTSGSIATVELPAKKVLSELTSRGLTDVAIAVVTAPECTVIAGARESIHELLATWNQRGVVAHESPVDIAYHSPQLDPIIEALADALGGIKPMTSRVPIYSATLFDPREQPTCDAAYWVTNARGMARFATAVQAALDDGFRVFAELAPDPHLTDPIVQTGRDRDLPLAALPAMRDGRPLPDGFLGLAADLYRAGAEVAFVADAPRGQLVDVPLPVWSHQRLWLDEARPASRATDGCTVDVHPLLGSHVRLPGEPERHVWQPDVDAVSPPAAVVPENDGALGHPEAAFCEMALAAARAVLGPESEVRDLRFGPAPSPHRSSVIGASAVLTGPGVAEFAVVSAHDGERGRHIAATLRAVPGGQKPAYDMPTLLAAQPRRCDGADVHPGAVGRRCSGGEVWTHLAEITLPRAVRSRLDDYVIHPALLAECFLSVGAHLSVSAVASGAPMLGVNRLRVNGSTARARYCYARVSSAADAVARVDIDVLDESGAVLVVVDGLQIGIESAKTRRDRRLSESLLGVEWQQRELATTEYADAGAWLMIDAGATVSPMVAALTSALTSAGAHCVSLRWSPTDRRDLPVDELGNQLRDRRFRGVVVLAGPGGGGTEKQPQPLSEDRVRCFARLFADLSRLCSEAPRLYVITVKAHTVVRGEAPCLEQASLSGLIRAIGAENPLLGASQIDIDDATGAVQVAQQLIGGSDEDMTAWRNGHWYTARLRRAPLRLNERQTKAVHNEHDGLRLRLRTPGDLGSAELVVCSRNAPSPGQIEVAVTASAIAAPDALAEQGEGEAKSSLLGGGFAGVVTAVGTGVTCHRVGDRVGGLAYAGSCRTYLLCDAGAAIALPPALGDAQAAAASSIQAWAWYALVELARVTAGDKVMIDCRASGVAQAAIAIARNIGADIFVLADNAEHLRLLHEDGVQHVYGPQLTGLVEQIHHDTGGYGIDIVLSSGDERLRLAGPRLLAVGGRFIDMNKGPDSAEISLEPPGRRNLMFAQVDLQLMATHQADQLNRLLTSVYGHVADGSLPAQPYRLLRLAEAPSALGSLGAAACSGPLIVDLSDSNVSAAVLPPAEISPFRRDGSYIISGDFDGLSLFFAQLMADRNCGRLVIISALTPDSSAQQALSAMQRHGVDVVVERGDVADFATVARAVETAKLGGFPLRGVLHAVSSAARPALADSTADAGESHWVRTVRGAWNLHCATTGQPVDWFCLFTSIATTVGSPGEEVRAAADSWLVGFSHWRRSQRLPANTIAWGTWSTRPCGGAATEPGGGAIIGEDGAYAFETLLRHDRVFSGYAPDWDENAKAVARRSLFAQMCGAAPHDSAGRAALLAELDRTPADRWPLLLRRVIADHASLIVRQNVDPGRSLFEYGLDSLGAHELRARIETETGVRIAITDITTIHNLTELLYEKLARVHAA